MGRRCKGLFPLLLLITWAAWAPAAEKIKVGTALKVHAVYALPMLAAEEKGFFNQQGLQAEWIPFSAAGALHRAAAAGAVPLGVDEVTGTIQAVARGVAIIIVSDLGVKNDFGIWVRTGSPIRESGDLRGRKIDVARLGGSSHAYARAVARNLGIEKEVRYVASGGVAEQIAALRSGAIDSTMITFFSVAPLAVKGEIREVVSVPDYLPREWMSRLLFARKELVEQSPESVTKVIKALLAAIEFIMKNREWALDRMQSFSRYSKEAAEVLYPRLIYSKDGRISRQALANVKQFLIDFGIIVLAEAPPVDDLYTARFTG